MNKISVIVPIYNSEQTLYRCINSIINQTYSNLEIILINDGSVDNSEKICEEMIKNDNRITYYKKNNGGLSSARNLGLKHITGDYISFIDSDDYIDLSFYSTMMKYLKENDADIVESGFKLIYTKEKIDDKVKNRNNEAIVLRDSNIINEYLNPKHKRIIFHGVCLKIFKKELFDGLSFEDNRLHEDLYIMYQLIEKCKIYVKVRNDIYYYYQNPDSITHTIKEKNIIDLYTIGKRIIDHYSYDKNLLNNAKCLAIEQYNFCLNAYFFSKNHIKIYPILDDIKLFLKNNVYNSSQTLFNKIFSIMRYILFSTLYRIKRGLSK